MNTNSLIKGVALALTLAAASVASAQAGAGQNRPERQRGAEADSGRGGRRGGEGMLLRGITLSSSQKTRIAELGAQQRKQMEANRPKRDGNQAARPQRERGDTAGMSARRAQMLKAREQHVASIRSILNNDQRVQFDKNVAELKSRVGQGGRGGEGFGGQRKDRKPVGDKR